MIGDFNTDKDGNVIDEPSLFQPSEAVKTLTQQVKQDYQTGHLINHRVFREFNDMSLIQRMDADQKAWNSYVKPKSDDPDEGWRWNGVRPVTRNKIISIAAHLTATILFPNVFAQNDQDEDDREAAEVMRYMIEWNIRNSNYELAFLHFVISALVNPISYMKAEFADVMQKVKDKLENGEITTEEAVDDVMSGFNVFVLPADGIMISNPYEPELQRQRFIIRKRFIGFDEAQGLYGDHPNFEYISPGVKTLYNDQDGMFYQQKNDEVDTLVEEVIYYNRREDIEVIYVDGIYLGDTNPEENRMKHRTNKNKPKYPFVKLIFESIDESFFFGRSSAMKLADDQELTDRMWQMVMDGTFLQVMPPIGVYGEETISSNVMFPGSVTNFGRDSQAAPLTTGGNLNAGLQALELVKGSMEESSQSDIRQGIQSKGNQTAWEIARLEENARIQLGLFGKMLGKAVKDFGELMVDLIIHNQTVAEVEGVLAGDVRMKFRTFLLEDQVQDGKKITRKINFDENLIGKKMTEEDRIKESFKIMEQEGGLDSKSRIYKVNPEKFSRLNFKIFIEPDKLMPKTEAFEKAIKLEAYDRMIQNPYVDQEAVTRDFLVETVAKGESDKYMAKKSSPIAGEAEGGSSSLIDQTAKGETRSAKNLLNQNV